MTKNCSVEGCNNEIPDWMDYCPTHYAMIQQEREQSEMAKKVVVPAQAQKTGKVYGQPMPVQPQQMPQQQRQVREMPEEQEEEELPLTNLMERERLIVKQTCLKASVDMLSNMDIGERDLNELTNDIRALMLKFYRMVVEHNEE